MTRRVRISLTQIPNIIREKGDLEVALWAWLIDEKFNGRLWAGTSVELAKYCRPILLNWIRSGRIYHEVGRVGRPVRGFGGRQPSKDDIEDLVAMTITQALDLFRAQALAGRGWRPELGTAMRTYVMGACLLTFSNCAREMTKSKQDTAREVPDGQTPLDADFATVDGPERQRRLRDLIEYLDITGKQAKIAVLTAYGFTQPEIAEILDMTPRAVEGVFRRLRRGFGGRGDRDRGNHDT